MHTWLDNDDCIHWFSGAAFFFNITRWQFPTFWIQGAEVPEEVLPEPFNRPKEGNLSTKSAQPCGTTSMQGVAFSGSSVRASLLPPSFKRSFSLRNSGHQVEKLKQEQLSFTAAALPSVSSEDKFAGVSSHEETSEIARVPGRETCSSYEASLGSKMLSTFPETPVKCTNPVEDEMASVLKTPLSMASTPMTATPALQPTKRCYMSPDNDSCRTPSKLVRRPPPNRPLKFDTPVKSVKNDDEDGRRAKSSARGDIFSILPQSLIQSVSITELAIVNLKCKTVSFLIWLFVCICRFKKRRDWQQWSRSQQSLKQWGVGKWLPAYPSSLTGFISSSNRSDAQSSQKRSWYRN